MSALSTSKADLDSQIASKKKTLQILILLLCLVSVAFSFPLLGNAGKKRSGRYLVACVASLPQRQKMHVRKELDSLA